MTGLRVFALVFVSTAVSHACSYQDADANLHHLLGLGTDPEAVADMAGCPDVATLESYLGLTVESFAVVSAPFKSSEGLADGTFVSRMSFDTTLTASALGNVPLAGPWGNGAALQLPEGCTVSGLGLTCGSSMNGSLAWSRVDWLNTGFDRSSNDNTFGRTSFSSFSRCTSFGSFGSLGFAAPLGALAIDGTRPIVDVPQPAVRVETGARATSRWFDRDESAAVVRHEQSPIGSRPDLSTRSLTRSERAQSRLDR